MPSLKKIDHTPQCQIVLFKWNVEQLGSRFIQGIDTARLSASTPIDISAYLTGTVSFTKRQSEAAGIFDFTLKDNINWKKVVKPGTWGLIYMSQNKDLAIPNVIQKTPISDFVGGKTGLPKPNLKKLSEQGDRLRAIIYIERVSDVGTAEENGVAHLTYSFSGKDFGTIYEDTEIYLNQFLAEETVVKAFKNRLNADSSRNKINNLLETIHNLMYAPHRELQLPRITKLFEAGLQWLWPRQLFTALGARPNFTSGSFYGNFPNLLNFSATDAKIPVTNPIQFLNGFVWDKLKSVSIQPLHELFTETTAKGRPQLTFRPIPWSIDPRGYPSLAPRIKSYLRLDEISIEAAEITDHNLGLDNHSRYNHFLTYIDNRIHSLQTNISQLSIPSISGRKFPHAVLQSIARHGLRRMHAQIDSFITFATKLDEARLLQYNELLYDYWSPAIFMESGSITLSGRNDVKIGKTLVTTDLNQHENEKFYIEGYTDTFSIYDNGEMEWTQDLTVTRGVQKEILRTLDLNKNPTTNNTTGEFKGF